MALLAPERSGGREQIIPNCGAHDQVYPTHKQIVALVKVGLIEYEPEYGPNAKVYRPRREGVDAERIRSWL